MYNINLESTGIIIYILKMFFISMCTFFTFFKIINVKFNNKSLIKTILATILIASLCGIVKFISDSFSSILFLIFLLSVLLSYNSNNKLGYSILITIIALSINYILFFIAIMSTLLINILIPIYSDLLNLIIMIIIHIIIYNLIGKIRKIKNGISFFKKHSENEYFDILILNISITILFSFIIFANREIPFIKSLFFSFIISAIVIVISIQKAFTMYYKYKLLVADLNYTKRELENKHKEIADLEAEILEFSKTSHSIAHKQKSLEYKLNTLMLQTESSEELDLRDRLDSISKEYSTNIATTPLPKTEIDIIDDMISYMDSECKNNDIDFELKLNGNIHHLINNFITKEELEILLADHIKDAIIAINYSDNINKSILVKLGLFDGEYILSVYDSGIEFKIETLLNLGIKPSTTHKESGGTGMGFMNTFDTLRKNNASLYINEIGKTTKENYTKSVTISFNNKNEYKITSYRADKIKEKNNRNDLIIE